MNDHGYYIERVDGGWCVFDERRPATSNKVNDRPYKQKAHAEARALTLAARRVGLVIRDLTKERVKDEEPARA